MLLREALVDACVGWDETRARLQAGDTLALDPAVVQDAELICGGLAEPAPDFEQLRERRMQRRGPWRSGSAMSGSAGSSPTPPPSAPREGLVLRALNCGCGCVMVLFAVSVLLWLLGSHAVGYFTD